jgi:hypothetical protein
MTEKLTGWAENLLDDLTSLQIDLIVKSEIGAARVPEPGHALVDIVKLYYDTMEEYRERHETKVREDLPLVRSQVSLADLQALRTWAKDMVLTINRELAALLEEKEDEHTPEQRKMLQAQGARDRYPLGVIRSGCDQLRGLLQRVGYNGRFGREEAGSIDLKLDQRGLSLVRKLWEIGIEVVIARTVIQLDGDVVMRLVPEVFEQQTEAVLAIQNQGVKTAVNFWRGLFDIARSFLSVLKPG